MSSMESSSVNFEAIDKCFCCGRNKNSHHEEELIQRESSDLVYLNSGGTVQPSHFMIAQLRTKVRCLSDTLSDMKKEKTSIHCEFEATMNEAEDVIHDLKVKLEASRNYGQRLSVELETCKKETNALSSLYSNLAQRVSVNDQDKKLPGIKMMTTPLESENEMLFKRILDLEHKLSQTEQEKRCLELQVNARDAILLESVNESLRQSFESFKNLTSTCSANSVNNDDVLTKRVKYVETLKNQISSLSSEVVTLRKKSDKYRLLSEENKHFKHFLREQTSSSSMSNLPINSSVSPSTLMDEFGHTTSSLSSISTSSRCNPHNNSANTSSLANKRTSSTSAVCSTTRVRRLSNISSHSQQQIECSFINSQQTNEQSENCQNTTSSVNDSELRRLKRENRLLKVDLFAITQMMAHLVIKKMSEQQQLVNNKSISVTPSLLENAFPTSQFPKMVDESPKGMSGRASSQNLHLSFQNLPSLLKVPIHKIADLVDMQYLNLTGDSTTAHHVKNDLFNILNSQSNNNERNSEISSIQDETNKQFTSLNSLVSKKISSLRAAVKDSKDAFSVNDNIVRKIESLSSQRADPSSPSASRDFEEKYQEKSSVTQKQHYLSDNEEQELEEEVDMFGFQTVSKHQVTTENDAFVKNISETPSIIYANQETYADEKFIFEECPTVDLITDFRGAKYSATLLAKSDEFKQCVENAKFQNAWN
eukprot:GDKJ01019099.1.p1 GENE.GDKJ01019099.1~~GDKJ01019099.1.p1  ORF type:complete len:707 (-),score=177.19 GDKJ01019099.1:73-2193(-)